MNEPEPHIQLRNRLDNNGQRLWDQNRPMAELLIAAADEIDRLGRRLWHADRAAVRMAKTIHRLREELDEAQFRARIWEDTATVTKASRSHHTEL